MGGTGGGVAYNREDYEHYCRSGMDASPVGQILVDESLLGWKEFEMEVVREGFALNLIGAAVITLVVYSWLG